MSGAAVPGLEPVRKKKAATAAAAVSFSQPPLSAPFLGTRTLHWALEEILPWLDKRLLIGSRWRMKEGAKAEQFFAETISLLQEKKITGFSAVYGYFACRRRGKNSLLLSNGDKSTVLDFPRRNTISLADYFRKNGDLAPFFIVTCGAAISLLEKELFAANQYSRYLLLHGLGVQLAESLAAKMHQHIRLELHLDEKQGKRFSPGYPAWPELADQKTLVQLLNAGKIGVCLSEKFQLIPELSVSAMVVSHPQAEYF